jgi:3-hydroxyisobutyrate dehydrogenase-like beta-hydroxyacid dehydrogenase
MLKEELYMISWTGSNKPIENIGLIGVGTMGKCMLQKLIEGNFKVTVYDKFPAAQKYAVEAGASLAETPAQVASKCNIVIMSLPGPVQIEQVVFGEDGLYSELTSDHVVIDTSTVDPNTTKNAAECLTKIGAAYLDCPILGRPSAVGRWMLPTGGNIEALEYCKPALNTFAAKVVSVGESGAGNALKLLNQMMFSTINSITSEVMSIAESVGISPKVFYETVSASGAATVSGLFCEVAKNIVAEDYNHPVFTVDLLIKDTKLALEMAKSSGAPSVIAGNVQIYNEIASANGFGSEDTSALYKIYKRHYKV